MIDLRQDYLEQIKKILGQHVPGYEVRVFGSRIKGKAKKHSDLDLALVGAEKIDSRLLDDLREAFAESDLPMRIDVVDWQTLSEEFKRIIEEDFVQL